ncbi:MAG: carotenoid oxygenase family protein [Candidatus Binatia bacterium]|nr:carotenoid oxygenase family protein [Candidatus Binatia bacterium]MDG2010803.1 carotenoid oxygenase family protein [Candidatus Binatia bacterium]
MESTIAVPDAGQTEPQREEHEAMSNEYLEGNFTGVSEEVTLACPEVEGQIPSDLAGNFLRNGPNPEFTPPMPDLYHPFDGDGMLHGVEFDQGKATYRNRWIETRGLLREREEGKALWGGFNTIGKVEPPADMPMKNLANTAMVYHNKKLLALWEAGLPHEISLPDLGTVGEENFGGWNHAVSAHPKVDPVTGEMILFCYSYGQAPFVKYGVVDPKGKLVHETAIDLAGKPVMIHDMAITEHYSLIFDMPVTFSLDRVMNGGEAFDWEPENGARIGVVPRYGQGSEIKWFDVETGYIFHTFNAWEEGDEIVLQACRSERTSILVSEQTEDQLGKMRRYRLNMTSGSVSEEKVSSIPMEFSRINETMLGRETRYGYASRFHPTRGLLFSGMLKHDRKTDAIETVEFGDTQFHQEMVFAPRVNSQSEDDGYVIGFVHDETDNHAECWVVDAQKFSDGPVARVRIPIRVPYGFHANWVGA